MNYKAYYINGYLNGCQCAKYFHTEAEMNEFFEKHPGCSLLYVKEGKEVRLEAKQRNIQ